MKWTSYALFETYLHSSVPIDDNNLQICSVSADHRSNTKHGGVLIYCKNFLPIKSINIKYLHESLNFKLKIGGKICKFFPLYTSPSQNKVDFETFLENLEFNFDHMAEKTLS